ncbi:hypothetical protein FGF1_03710 [Flavobacteriaceae bacterium GF1]
MEEVKAYVKEIEPEFNWDDGEVYLFLYYFQLEDFMKLLDECVFDDGAITLSCQPDYVCLEMKYICDYMGWDIEELFGTEQ